MSRESLPRHLKQTVLCDEEILERSCDQTSEEDVSFERDTSHRKTPEGTMPKSEHQMDTDDEFIKHGGGEVEVSVKVPSAKKSSAAKPRKRIVDSDEEVVEASKPKKRGPAKKVKNVHVAAAGVEEEGLDVDVGGGKRISPIANHNKADLKRRRTAKQYEDELEETLNAELERFKGEDQVEAEEERSRIVEAGQIVTIYMENFMCHKKFTVTLGRHLNFISGRNGSGKSTVASALQICFGSSAKIAGRGPNMREYIREGSPGPAIIRVTLINEGPDAYQQDLYGKRITVERKIASSGGSTYQLISEGGEVISRAKKDLDYMLQMFNIYVSNPCNIMTQEESKKFVYENAEDKYKFFLKATGLQNLREDLLEIQNNIREADIEREKERSRVAAKESSVAALKEKLDKLIELETLGDKIKMCQIKAFWDDLRVAADAVSVVQEELEAKRSAYEKEKEKYEEVMRSESEKADDIEKFNAVIQEIETEVNKVQDEILSRVSAVHAATKLKKEVDSKTKELDEALQDFVKRKANVEREIYEIRNKAMQSSMGNEREMIAEIAGYDFYTTLLHAAVWFLFILSNSRIEQLRNVEHEAREEKSKVLIEYIEAENTSRRAGTTASNLDRDIRAQEEHIRNLMSGGGNDKAGAFDRRLPEFLRLVQNTSFRGQVVGPAGLNIKIREGYQPIERAVEKAVGRFMFAFIVETDEDRVKLQQMMKRANKLDNRFFVVQQPHHSGRYPVRNPPPGVTTLLSAVHIEHDLLYNAMVDQIGAENVALVMTDPDVKALVETDDGGRERLKYGLSSVIVEKDLSTIKYKEGNKSDEANRHDPSGVMSTDSRSVIENARRALADKQVAFQDAEQHRIGMRSTLQALHSRKNELDHTLTQVGNDLRNLTRQKQAANEKLNELQEAERVETTLQEGEREDLVNAIETMKGQLESLKQEQAAANNALKDAIANKRELEGQKERHMLRLKEQQDQINLIMTNRTNAKKRIETLQLLVGEKEREMHQVEDTLNNALENADEKRAIAVHKTQAEYPDSDGKDIDLDRNETRPALERKAKELQAKLTIGRREGGFQGYTVEGLTERYNQAKSELDDLNECLQRLEENISTLEKSLDEREVKLKKALKRTTWTVKHRFDDYVKERGSAGTINFNHKDKVLNIEFQVDSSNSDTVANDMKNLSGGERSFVTFCLQLALGHVIECPFRLLDEYDVFMDESSRTLTLKMMMRYTQKEDQRNRQFLILTPHHLRDIRTSNSVKIIHMPEPVRRTAQGLQQQTLDV